MTAADPMDLAASLLNDTAKTVYTYTAQIPYLNIALNELQEAYELNNIPLSNETSAALAITAGVTDIGGSTGPALPTDLIEIQQLFQRQNGTTNDFLPMVRVDFLPKTSILTSELGVWTWQNQIINFIPANTAVDVKIDYVAARMAKVTVSTTPITAFNAITFLSFRCAALCAEFIGENKSRADSLNPNAAAALDRLLGIGTKGAQAIAVRHRPFMARYKSRGY